MKIPINRKVNWLMVIFLVVLLAMVAMFTFGCKPIEQIPINNSVQVEIDGDTIRYYYTEYVIERNGKYKTWTTHKVYLPNKDTVSDAMKDEIWLINSKNEFK